MDLSDLYAEIWHIAEALRPQIDAGRVDIVRQIMATADVVFGVWPRADPGDTGMMIIKGLGFVEDGALAGMGCEAKISAIPCASAEEAEATKRALGDGALDGSRTVN